MKKFTTKSFLMNMGAIALSFGIGFILILNNLKVIGLLFLLLSVLWLGLTAFRVWVEEEDLFLKPTVYRSSRFKGSLYVKVYSDNQAFYQPVNRVFKELYSSTSRSERIPDTDCVFSEI